MDKLSAKIYLTGKILELGKTLIKCMKAFGIN